MDIIYDYQIFSLQEYGGASRYFYEVASRIAEYNKYAVRIVAPLYINKYLKNNKSSLVIGQYTPPIPKTNRVRGYINAVVTKGLLHKIKPDIVHETYYNVIKLSPGKTVTVITVLDMIHEKFREWFSVNDSTSIIKNSAVNRADHVICISENTKNDLMEIFHVKPSKISVVYLGHSLTLNLPLFGKRIFTHPYILYVGDRVGYKNFYRLLRAYMASNKLKNDFKLVCFGGKEFSIEELKEFKILGVMPEQIQHVTGDDRILANLYYYASILVYPSLYEGFGIPPLEAMSYKCPVACSNTGSLPEVVGDAVEYFDPHNTESILSSIEKVVYSIDESETLIARGLEKFKQFTWEACAKQTSLVYASLL